jgi:integrase
MGRKAKLPRHIYWRGGALYGWYYGPDGTTKIKRSTGCTDPAAAAAKLAEWERDAADPLAATRRSAKLSDAFDLLDADRAALIAAGKRSENSKEFYEAARNVWCRYAGRLIEGVTCSDDELDADRLKQLVDIGGRARLCDVGTAFVDGFITYRRTEGRTENTIAKNRSTMFGALLLARRAGVWTGDLTDMFPPGFETCYSPQRVDLSHEDAWRLVHYFDHQPHHRAQIAFVLACGAEEQAIVRALRADLDQKPLPLHGTKTDFRERHCFIALPWQEELLKIAKAGVDGKEAFAFHPWHNAVRDLAAACTELKLPRLGLHKLRHVFTGWAVDDGVSISEVAKALGHTDTRMLERVYDKRDPATMQRRAEEQAAQRQQVRLSLIEGGKSAKNGRRKAS